jgi:hypothetical protein
MGPTPSPDWQVDDDSVVGYTVSTTDPGGGAITSEISLTMYILIMPVEFPDPENGFEHIEVIIDVA